MRTAWLVLAISTLVPQAALAQSAERLVDEGIALREQRRDAEALERFGRAYELAPSPRILAQMALAEQALGRFADAEEHLRAALAVEDDRFVRRHRPLLMEALREIEGQLGTLELRGGIEGARVRLGDRELGVLPLAPVRLAPGELELEVSADGHAPFRAAVRAQAGQTLVVDVALEPIEERREPEPIAPRPPEPAPSAGPSWTLISGIAALGLGVAGLAIGSGLMAVREEHAQARQTCSDGDPDCRARFYAALDAEAGAIASYVAGGVVIAAGAALLVWALLGASDAPESTACGPGPGELGLACGARF